MVSPCWDVETSKFVDEPIRDQNARPQSMLYIVARGGLQIVLGGACRDAGPYNGGKSNFSSEPSLRRIMRFHLKHLIWLVVISAAILALTRHDPAALLGVYVVVVSYVALLVAGRATEILDGVWETGWAGLFHGKKRAPRAGAWFTVLLGVAVAICLWVVALFLGTGVYRFFKQ